MTRDQLNDWLRERAKEFGTQQKFAASKGVSNSYLSRVLTGEVERPSSGFLAAVGLTETYEPVNG